MTSTTTTTNRTSQPAVRMCANRMRRVHGAHATNRDRRRRWFIVDTDNVLFMPVATAMLSVAVVMCSAVSVANSAFTWQQQQGQPKQQPELVMPAVSVAGIAEPVTVRAVGSKLDKVTATSDGLWAAGDGQVFFYNPTHQNWTSKFGQLAPPGIPAITMGLARLNANGSSGAGTIGVVCFSADSGLCAVFSYDDQEQGFRPVWLNREIPVNYGSLDGLVTPLENHGSGSPFLLAINRNTTTRNESPLSLLEISQNDLKNAELHSEQPPTFRSHSKGHGSYSLMFHNELPPFTIQYLYSFQYNGFVFVVTVQPMLKDNVFNGLRRPIFETRVARFCISDPFMRSYTELPISCESRRTFHVAVRARHVVRGSRWTLLVTMGKATDGTHTLDRSEKTALCAFDIEDLSRAFDRLVQLCSDGHTTDLVRQSVYYQRTDVVSAPLACHKSNERHPCKISENRFIVGMTTYKGKVIFSTEKKNPPDVTYIYRHTRTESPPMGLLTTFEVEEPMTHIEDDTLHVWVADDLGYIHRLLHSDNFTVHLMTIDPKLLDGRRERTEDPSSAVDHHAIVNSAQLGDKLHFLAGHDVIEINTTQRCAFYLNCGDCLNPSHAVGEKLPCTWLEGRCVPGEDHLASCEPFISLDRSGPFEGPEKGGNLITFRGIDLGGELATVKINVGNKDCKRREWSNLGGSCVVPPNEQQRTVPVTILISNLLIDTRLKAYQISTNGLATIANYTYYPVQFIGVYPSFGPQAGGTRLTLRGVNIGRGHSDDAGELVGNDNFVICDELAVINRTTLACNTAPFRGGHGINQRLSVSLRINNVLYPANGSTDTAEVFDYRKNPEHVKVTADSRLDFFFSGGHEHNILFAGDNLDAAAEVSLLVSPFGHNSVRVNASCIQRRSRQVACKAPSLVGHMPDVTSLSRSLPAKMELHVDGFVYYSQAQLTYHPNASIAVGRAQSIVLANGETQLTILGKHLSPYDRNGVAVSVDGKPCMISEVTDTKIVCVMHLDQGEYKFEVKLGNASATSAIRRFTDSIVITDSANGVAWGAILAIVGVLLILVVAAVLTTFYTLRRRMKVVQPEPSVSFRPENDGYLNPDSERLLTTIPPDPEIINLLSEWGLLMDFSCIQVGALIGKGQFGCVYRGVLRRDKLSAEEAVAVKTLQQRGYTTNDANVFLKEALRMKDFNHPNVLCLIGVSFDNNNSTDPMIIVPYMANGDLLAYIRNQDNTPTVKDLITFGANIAQGMSYLASQKFIHRDLAARNCMLGEDMIVRVADFGLSRDVYETSYYSSDNCKTKLPVKWMALESLVDGYYSHKSDVWSFGVVLWELMTRGCQPYPSVDNWEVHLWLKEGRRMLQPAYCPDSLYKIMLQCWHEDPQQRPTFSQLVKDVPNVIHTIEMATRNTVPNYVNAD